MQTQFSILSKLLWQDRQGGAMSLSPLRYFNNYAYLSAVLFYKPF